MTYSPVNYNKKPLFITSILTALSVFCFVYAGSIPAYTWLMQLGFVIFATVAIQIFLRFVLTKFEYVCDGESLMINKSMGSRKQMVGKLELNNSASYIMTENEYKKSGEDYRVKSEYTYTRNFNSKDTYVYITTIGETNFMIKIEVNDEFATYVNNKIDGILKGHREND